MIGRSARPRHRATLRGALTAALRVRDVSHGRSGGGRGDRRGHFERVVRTRRRFDRSKGSEQAWIYAIAVNLVTDHLRRAGAERRALDGASAPTSPQTLTATRSSASPSVTRSIARSTGSSPSCARRSPCASVPTCAGRTSRSSTRLPVSTVPSEVMAYCALVDGDRARAVRRMEQAVRRDPANWRLRYGLARMQAMAGRDPRRAAREALRLSPLEPLTRDAVNRFAGTQRPAQWRRAAQGMEILLPEV